MEWPAPEEGMRVNFGANEGGYPSLGAVFESEGAVAAADDGELVLDWTDGTKASRLPSPLGEWAAFDHGGGLVGVYGRLGGERPRVSEKVKRGEAIAAAGVSGWTARRGFYFSVFDRKERRRINPTALTANRRADAPPEIRSVRLRRGGQTIALTGRNAVRRGNYGVLVDAAVSPPAALGTARRSPAVSFAPARIVLLLNGLEVDALDFDSLSASGGVLLSRRKEPVPAAKVYSAFPGFEAGEIFFPGGQQATLEVIVSDFEGNSRSAVYRILVE
jgi:hypothetical protein